jgi:hypothetical protein
MGSRDIIKKQNVAGLIVDFVVLAEPVRVGRGEPPPKNERRSEDAAETAGGIPMKLGTAGDIPPGYIW